MNSSDDENRVFWGLLAASCAHVVEEYVYPGGFLESAREVAPEAFEHASIPIVIGVNASMIMGCLNAALMRRRNPFYGLSMASLLFFNAILHSGASIRLRKYSPGLLTGLCLYVPLSAYAFVSYARSSGFKRSTAISAAVSGVALHSIPFVAFATRAALTRRSDEEG
ncbi:MAG TPA: HXXEE domain-containing protein [Candidatus Anoxymicrobiaceae bacterium]